MKQYLRENQIFEVHINREEFKERPFLNIKCKKNGKKQEITALFVTTTNRISLCKQYRLRRLKNSCLLTKASYVNFIKDFIVLSLSAKPSLDKKIRLCKHSPCLGQEEFEKILKLYNVWQEFNYLMSIFLKEEELKILPKK